MRERLSRRDAPTRVECKAAENEIRSGVDICGALPPAARSPHRARLSAQSRAKQLAPLRLPRVDAHEAAAAATPRGARQRARRRARRRRVALVEKDALPARLEGLLRFALREEGEDLGSKQKK